MLKIALIMLLFFSFKFTKMVNKFDISENIGHSHIKKVKTKDNGLD